MGDFGLAEKIPDHRSVNCIVITQEIRLDILHASRERDESSQGLIDELPFFHKALVSIPESKRLRSCDVVSTSLA